jgi:hypothetical protein
MTRFFGLISAALMAALLLGATPGVASNLPPPGASALTNVATGCGSAKLAAPVQSVNSTVDDAADLKACLNAKASVIIPNGPNYTLTLGGGIIWPDNVRVECANWNYYCFQQMKTGLGTTATGVISVKAAHVNGDIDTINGQAISWVTSGATGFQLNITGTVAGDVAAELALIQANTSTFAVTAVQDTVNTAAIDLTAVNPGVAGNLVTLATTDTATTYLSESQLNGGGFTVANNPQTLNGVQLANLSIYGNTTNVLAQTAATVNGTIAPGSGGTPPTLTMTSTPTAPFAAGMKIACSGCTSGTIITQQLTGAAGGANGATFAVDFSQTVASPVAITASNSVGCFYLGHDGAPNFASYSSGTVIPDDDVGGLYTYGCTGVSARIGAYTRDSNVYRFTIRHGGFYGIQYFTSDAYLGIGDVSESALSNYFIQANHDRLSNLTGWGACNYNTAAVDFDNKSPRNFLIVSSTRLHGDLSSQEACGAGFDFQGINGVNNDEMDLTLDSDGDDGAGLSSGPCVNAYKLYHSQLRGTCGKVNSTSFGTPYNVVALSSSCYNDITFSYGTIASYALTTDATSQVCNHVSLNQQNDQVYTGVCAACTTYGPRPDVHRWEIIPQKTAILRIQAPIFAHMMMGQEEDLVIVEDGTHATEFNTAGYTLPSGLCGGSAGSGGEAGYTVIPAGTAGKTYRWRFYMSTTSTMQLIGGTCPVAE